MELQKNFKYFDDNRDALVEKYRGKYVVIHNSAVMSEHDSFAEAAVSARQKYKDGEFIVKHCIPKSEETPIHFYSRVGVWDVSWFTKEKWGARYNY